MGEIAPWIDREEWEVWYRGPAASLIQWAVYGSEDGAMAKARELAAIGGMEWVEVRQVMAQYRAERRDPRGTVVL